jgi:hypothetical protein
MKYYKVKLRTKQWDCFHKYWTFEDKWKEHKEEIEHLIESDWIENLLLRTESLCLENPPEHLKSQFKKWNKDYKYEAKKNSSINIAWLELVNKLGLEVYTHGKLFGDIGVLFRTHGMKTLYPIMGSDYYFAVDQDKLNSVTNSLNWSENEWVEEVDEPTFLRIRADWLEQDKSA